MVLKLIGLAWKIYLSLTIGGAIKYLEGFRDSCWSLRDYNVRVPAFGFSDWLLFVLIAEILIEPMLEVSS